MKGTIIYYGGFALPDKNASANRVVSNGKLFESLGYNTIFLGAYYDCGHFDGIRRHPENENMFEEVHPATSREWIKHILEIKNLKAIVSRYEDVKLVLLYNAPFITLFLAKKYFSKKNITVAYDCTEWTQYTDGSILKKAFKYIDEFFIRKFAHLVADKMIVISKIMEEAYKKNKKLLRLPPLVDINDEIWHQKTEKSDEGFTLCFAGFPDGNKESLDKAIETIQLFERKDIKFNVVGITREEFETLYPDTQILKENEKRICFLGRQTHRDTIKYILDCDCYIFIRPSDRRSNAGFPTKFAEGYTCGVSIITTDVSDIKDYIKTSKDGILLKNTDTESVYLAIKSVLEKGKKEGSPALKTAFHYEEYRNKADVWVK